MIYTIEDFSDEAEARAERRQRRAHDGYMDQSPASGTWWRNAEDDDLERAPEGLSVRRRPNGNGSGFDVPRTKPIKWG